MTPHPHKHVDTHTHAQMAKKQEEVETIQEYNCILLSNLMPDNHFLTPSVVGALVSIIEASSYNDYSHT